MMNGDEYLKVVYKLLDCHWNSASCPMPASSSALPMMSLYWNKSKCLSRLVAFPNGSFDGLLGSLWSAWWFLQLSGNGLGGGSHPVSVSLLASSGRAPWWWLYRSGPGLPPTYPGLLLGRLVKRGSSFFFGIHTLVAWVLHGSSTWSRLEHWPSISYIDHPTRTLTIRLVH